MREGSIDRPEESTDGALRGEFDFCSTGLGKSESVVRHQESGGPNAITHLSSVPKH